MKRRRPSPEPPALQETEYGAMFERLSGDAGLKVETLFREVDEAAGLLAEILGAPEAERRALLDQGVRFRSLRLCALLEARCREVWFHDPAQAVSLAELAVAMAERLDDEHYGLALVEDARATAWAHLGNALRIAADLPAAERALDMAETHLQRSGGEAYTEALILSFRASLRTTQGRYEEAVRLLDDALVIYREARDRHMEGRTLIKKGTALGLLGRYAEAVRLIRRGLSKIDLIHEPGLLVTAHHNLIVFLTESGQHRQAREDLAKTRRLYLDLGKRMNLVRLRWLEGKIARGEGEWEEAGAALWEAQEAFLREGIAVDAALVSLDLAVLHLRHGDSAGIRQLAAEMLPILEAGGVHPDAMAALLLFQQAAEADEVTLDLLDGIATAVRRAHGRPGR
jgi:tetratricopeptide (TPR) repeat protein